MTEEKKLTGYPSIDKPWLKYYSDEAINAPLPEMTMYQYIWERNKDNLSDTAFCFFGRRISYKMVFTQIKRAADALYSAGIRSGDTVSIMSIHTPETIYTIYALNYIGATANIIYLTLAEKEIIHTLKVTNSKLLFVLDAVAERVCRIQDLPCPVVELSVGDSMPWPVKVGYKLRSKPARRNNTTWDQFLGESSSTAMQSQDPFSSAIIVYTSGTTGEPKGVVLNSIAMNSVPDQLIKTDRNYKRQETFLHQMPVFVAFGIGMLHLGLSVGICVILGLANDVESASKMFSKYKPQRYVSGPPVLDGIMKYTKGSLRNVIEFTGGGEAISPEKEDEFNAFLLKHNSPTKYAPGYGMSEFASVATLNMKKAYKRGSVGVPLVHINVKVVDTETHQELKYGEIGELCVCAPNSMTEYYNNPEATSRAIEIDLDSKRWIHTEDLAYVDTDGFVFIVGRIKRVYVTRDMDGYFVKIYPQRIEDVLNACPLVQNSAVVVRKDEERVNVPVAFVTLRNPEDKLLSQTKEDIYSFAKKELPEYDFPKSINILEEMPITQTSKIDYQALERMV